MEGLTAILSFLFSLRQKSWEIEAFLRVTLPCHLSSEWKWGMCQGFKRVVLGPHVWVFMWGLWVGDRAEQPQKSQWQGEAAELCGVTVM